MHVRALIFGALVVGPLSYGLWRLILDDAGIFFWLDSPPEVFLGGLFALMLSHELCHVLLHPKFGFSANSIVGFDRRSFLAFATYSGNISRNRFVAMALAPLFFISVVPFVLGSIYREYAHFVASISLFNAVISAGDIMILWRCLRILPRHGLVDGTYFGLPPDPAAS